MTPTEYAAFTQRLFDTVAANDAEREARIAALVARADFGAWSAECDRLAS